MKKIILLSFLLLGVLSSGWSQDTVKKNNAAQRHDWQKIAAMKKQYFKDSLKLDDKTAKDFWKVYDENCQQEKNIHEKFKAFKEKNNIKTDKGHLNVKKMDEKTAVAFMEAKKTMNADLTNLELTYFKKLKKVLPDDKLLEYYRLDKSFMKKMVSEKQKAGQKKKAKAKKMEPVQSQKRR